MTRLAWRYARRAVSRRTGHLPGAVRGLLWAMAAATLFSFLNALARWLAQDVPAMQSMFLRYLFGGAVILPMIWHQGLAAYRPKAVGGQFLRGAVHTTGLALWFIALPRIPLADTTAIGFTTPLFILVGAWLLFSEPMRWERWLATAIGFFGVLIVVGPQLSLGGGGPGLYHLVMLASAPLFAASQLITKALTRHENTGTIVVWQAITITLFSLPLAVAVWQPLAWWQWAGFLLCGLIGSAAQFCLTRSMAVADISATQSARFLELVWAALLGWVVFTDIPTATTLAGGGLICAATLWVARREAQRTSSAPRGSGLSVTPSPDTSANALAADKTPAPHAESR
ncbi:MAG: hypothetical protein RLZ83_1220 [Pseudomonadota bacterium]|jgi:drug/metabolite transporter (DMT)-like permease